MFDRLLAGAALTAILAVANPGALAAHAGHTHKVLGTVASVQGSHVEVKTTDGKTVTVMLDAKTKITRGKEKLDASAIKVGGTRLDRRDGGERHDDGSGGQTRGGGKAVVASASSFELYRDGRRCAAAVGQFGRRPAGHGDDPGGSAQRRRPGCRRRDPGQRDHHDCRSCWRRRLALPAGALELTVTRDGYLPSTIVLTITAGERRVVPVELQKLQEEVFVTAARSTTPAAGSAAARRGRRPGGDRREGDDDARQRGDAGQRDDRPARADDRADAGRRERPHPGAPGPLLAAARRRPAALRRAGRFARASCRCRRSISARSKSSRASASALYGAAALGGVINLVSRRPRETESRLLVNAHVAERPRRGRISRRGAGGRVGVDAARQLQRPNAASDLDGDGWSDLPTFNRGVLRPRRVLRNRRAAPRLRRSALIAENREGGTMPVRVAPDGRPFRQAVDTRHVDGGFVGRWLTAGSRVLSRARLGSSPTAAAAVGRGGRARTRASVVRGGDAAGVSGRHTWVVGGALPAGSVHARSAAAVRLPFSAPAVFAQDEDRASARRCTLG